MMMKAYKHTVHRRAFTLVELAIVLVIIGLMAGGIIAGQSMIRASQLRDFVAQSEKFLTATRSFREQYAGLPGDMTNATNYWGAAHAAPATCAVTASTTVATCNGNGDGLISNNWANSNEAFRFWQHLANAGLVDGQYDGITHGGNSYSATAANVPAGKIKTSLWFVNDWGVQSGSGSLFDGTYGNSFEFGGVSANNEPVASIFRTDEMLSIDDKIDDGKPAQGKLVVKGAITTCTNAASSASTNANYVTNANSFDCVAIFRNAF